ncbi:hypothetical protein M885DRAFT_511356 [Pelagophyceae sp. CCMP2097]|nr:hypothetical protein M885DRAFT_511356 [Pelagophyceae sp. CCMP2097]
MHPLRTLLVATHMAAALEPQSRALTRALTPHQSQASVRLASERLRRCAEAAQRQLCALSGAVEATIDDGAPWRDGDGNAVLAFAAAAAADALTAAAAGGVQWPQMLVAAGLLCEADESLVRKDPDDASRLGAATCATLLALGRTADAAALLPEGAVAEGASADATFADGAAAGALRGHRRRAAAALLHVVDLAQHAATAPEDAVVAHSKMCSAALAFGLRNGADVKILAAFARGAGVVCGGDTEIEHLARNAIGAALKMAAAVDSDDSRDAAAGALALACQLEPWATVDACATVTSAMDLGLWDQAADVCASTRRFAKRRADVHADSREVSGGAAVYASAAATHASAAATLVDGAMSISQYRRADTFATRFFWACGDRRLVEARAAHAKDTVAKLVRKRQLGVIERIILGVDEACSRERDARGADSKAEAYHRGVRLDVREFAISAMRRDAQHALADRVATIWRDRDGIEVTAADPEAAARDDLLRKETYLQWSDIFDAAPPSPISDAEELETAVAQMLFADAKKGWAEAIGFDVEWADDSAAAALLQLSSRSRAILVDIPALSKTPEGSEALRRSIGELFSRPNCAIVGFGAAQDLKSLRAVPCVLDRHWLGEVASLVEVKTLVVKVQPQHRQSGLSAISAWLLGKPLDKAEQCSRWADRPLSNHQCVYAALDVIPRLRVGKTFLRLAEEHRRGYSDVGDSSRPSDAWRCGRRKIP